MSTLYLVATPIGNRDDISFRALDVLFKANIILAEDTRKTKNLLNFYSKKINKSFSGRLVSFYEEVEEQKISLIINWLKEGKKVALVSNAGTPLISDPGYRLVRQSVKENIKIISIPGPCALINALVISGLPVDKFLFLGFLSKKSKKRQAIFSTLKQVPKITIIFYESPFRIQKTLSDLKIIFGNIEVVVARELTKKYEEIKRVKIDKILKIYQKKQPKGELVILFRT